MAEFVRDHEELARRVAALRAAGRRVVFTNGAFDVLHVGHVRCLTDARAAGDALVVAVNSDASVRRLKGEGRPYMPAGERVEILAALAAVDLLTLFDAPTVDALLELLRPDVYAKGTDYPLDALPEAPTVGRLGIEYCTTGDPKTRSATGFVARLRAPPPREE